MLEASRSLLTIQQKLGSRSEVWPVAEMKGTVWFVDAATDGAAQHLVPNNTENYSCHLNWKDDDNARGTVSPC